MNLLERVTADYNNIHSLSDLCVWMARDDFVKKWSWAVPSKDAIAAIAAFVGTDTLLEVGAGSGLWARLLHEHVKVWATDRDPWPNAYYHIEPLDGVDAVCEFRPQALMFCWPHFSDSWDAAALAAFKGNKVIYIGEDEGGCTGSPDFHSLLDREFEIISRHEIPQFRSIHDALFLFSRRSAGDSAQR